ncbi:MAG: hypothetical protein NT091_01480, partial [Candidatus Falkowbacteria bacterium]|nr:hypothetical protein [Candidatus Falkowbacteria bacterium]
MKNNLNIFKKVGLCFFVSALFFGGFWIDSVLAGIEDYSVVANNTFIQTGGGVGNYDLPFPSQPIVTVSDDQGNQVVGALVVATKVTGTGSIRNATTTTDSSGQANFTTLGYSKSGESFVIKFVAIIGTSTVESATSTVNAMSTGTNNSLRWVTSPAISSYISANWTSFSIEILDAAGDRVATSSDIVTIAGANLAGTLSTTTVNGLATFNDVLATATGTLTIIGTSAGLTSTASSSSVTVYSAPNNVSLSAATSTLSVGSSTILTATIKDAYGDVVTSDNSTTVTFATSTANGTISSSSVQVVNGIATTSLNRVGSGLFSVTATSTALTGASLSYTAIAPSTI